MTGAESAAPEPAGPARGGVGERIRAAREAARISVRELARRVEVSPSHVSQVERGLASFSVRTLYNVASELGLSMDTLFDDTPAVASRPRERRDAIDPPSGPARAEGEDSLVDSGIVLRVADRPAIPLAGGTRWERLTARPERDAEFIEVVYPPAGPASARPKDFIQHASREYGLVVAGTLTVQVGFDVTTLRAGDSIAFDSVVPHRFWNETAEEVRAVWFIRDLPKAPADGLPAQDPHSILRAHGAVPS